MNFLTVNGISKQTGRDFLLEDIYFNQERFQKIGIAGETGSGKSTLLKIMAGLMQPDKGAVFFEGERVFGPDEKLIPGHSGIAYLSQHFELRNNYFVEELLDMANKISPAEAARVYDVCRISHLLKRRTDQLSGGEKQRIATARLLVTAPRLLLLDEPFSNLDMGHRNILKQVVADIGEELQISSIMISHDPLDILPWADEIIVMKDGRIVQTGEPRKVYSQPINEYTAGLFGTYNTIPSDMSTAFGAPSPATTSKKVFARPESFKLVEDEGNTLIGEVRNVNFLGSYSEVEVMVEEASITVRAYDKTPSTGDLVFVNANIDNFWYF
jgi:ABC-type sulfate/molybdate transport systems ATPase subunit